MISRHCRKPAAARPSRRSPGCRRPPLRQTLAELRMDRGGRQLIGEIAAAITMLPVLWLMASAFVLLEPLP
jgi:hypothetical protein